MLMLSLNSNNRYDITSGFDGEVLVARLYVGMLPTVPFHARGGHIKVGVGHLG